MTKARWQFPVAVAFVVLAAALFFSRKTTSVPSFVNGSVVRLKQDFELKKYHLQEPGREHFFSETWNPDLHQFHRDPGSLCELAILAPENHVGDALVYKAGSRYGVVSSDTTDGKLEIDLLTADSATNSLPQHQLLIRCGPGKTAEELKKSFSYLFLEEEK